MDKTLVEEMYACFLRCLSEYTMESRGDVGAWVREAAMTALQVIFNLHKSTCLGFGLNLEWSIRLISAFS